MEHVANLWQDSFRQAMKQVHVHALRTRIAKAWGPVIDKESDALIAAMDIKWAAMVAHVKAAEARNGFNNPIRNLWLQQK